MSYSQLLILALLILSNCSYRFSNLHMVPPAGIHTIGIEGIYDTSQNFIEHEILWKELQKAVARAGKLALADIHNADAVLRVHISEVKESLHGADRIIRKEIKDQVLNPETQALSRPSSFQDLRRADNFTRKKTTGAALTVEIWNSRTQDLIMHRQYYLAYEVGLLSPGVPLKNQFIQSKETASYLLEQNAEVLAAQIIRDFLIPAE